MSGSWDFGGGTAPSGGQDSWSDISTPSHAPGASFGPGASEGDPSGGHAPTGGGLGSSAPLVWLLIGVAAAVCSIAVGLLTSSAGLATGAWALGGPVAIGLLAVFVNADNNARANPWYAESAVTSWGRRALVVLALVAVGLNAWTIADHVARMGS